VTSHPRATAYLHILLPKNPFPPQTTIFFTAVILLLWFVFNSNALKYYEQWTDIIIEALTN